MAEDTQKTDAAAAVPEQAIALCARALQANQDNNHRAAIQFARRALKIAPGMSKASLLLSSVLLRLGRTGDALPVLKASLKHDPKNPGLWNNLGNAYRRLENWGPARAAFEQALKLDGKYRLAWESLLQTQVQQKDGTGALKSAEAMLKLFGEEEKLLFARADALFSLDRKEEALDAFTALLAKPPFNAHALDRWTKIMLDSEREDDALQRLHQMAAEEPANPAVWGNIGSVENRRGNGDAARAGFFRAHELAPKVLRYQHDVGIVDRYMGNIEAAHEWFGKCLAIDPFHPSSLRVHAAEHKFVYGDDAFKRVNRAAARLPLLPPEAKVQLHYALGKAFDDVGDIATAFEHYVIGGHTHLKLNPFNDEERGRLEHVLKTALTKEGMANPSEPGCDDPTPVFILGMPRSGTSLIEQVLASHPDVHGAGELKLLSRSINGVVLNSKYRINFAERQGHWPSEQAVGYVERGARYIEELRNIANTPAKRIVDKMPGNHVWVGLIHLFMPKASIIHTRRHPVEICLSCFRIFFPDGLLWSYDLKELGRAYRHYHDHMEFWRSILPAGRMLEVRYEDMVNDLEGQARRIIDYTGLEWNDACLNFHETDRPVKTASAAQVRQPIYTSSTNRWRKYEPYLKPLLQELGPLVKQYEDELAATYPRG